MTVRLRPLALEAVEDRCTPSAGRSDHRPPADLFAAHAQAAGPGDDHRGPGRGADGPGADRPSDRGPGRAEVVPLVPRGAPPIERPRAVAVIETAQAGEPAAVRGERPAAPPARVVVAERPAARAVAAVEATPPTDAAAQPTPTGERAAAAPLPSVTRPVVEWVATTVLATPANPLPTAAADPAGPTATAAPSWVAVGESAPPAEELVLPGVAVEPPPAAPLAAAVQAAQSLAAAVAPLVPLAGAVPVDLAAVERAAADLLAGLTADATADAVPAGRWGWAGLGVILAGGLAHLLRPAPDRRPATAVGNDSALARWETRHDRRPA